VVHANALLTALGRRILVKRGRGVGVAGGGGCRVDGGFPGDDVSVAAAVACGGSRRLEDRSITASAVTAPHPMEVEDRTCELRLARRLGAASPGRWG